MDDDMKNHPCLTRDQIRQRIPDIEDRLRLAASLLVDSLLSLDSINPDNEQK